MHVLSFTARKGCIVLELEAVMHPRRPRNNNNNAAEEAAASQSERTSVGGPGPAGATTSSGLTGFDSDSEGDEATTTLDPIAWLELMQVDKLLPAGATVSIRVSEPLITHPISILTQSCGSSPTLSPLLQPLVTL